MTTERTCPPWCAYQTPHDHLASGDLVESGKGPTMPGVVSLKCATCYRRTTRIIQPEGNPT